MQGIFGKLRAIFTPSARETTEEPYASLSWLEADQSPFGVRTLDLTPTAEGLTPKVPDPDTRRRIASWPGRTGSAYDQAALPDDAPSFPARLRFPVDGPLPDGPLFLPRAAEEKWALLHRGGRLLLVRSWTGALAATAPLSTSGTTAEIGPITGDPTGSGDPDHPARVVSFLLRSHALGEIRPAPLPRTLPADKKSIALWCYQQFGRRAPAACTTPPADGPADRPLRADSALILAIIARNQGATQRAIEAGADLTARGTWHGFTPLHCAAAVGDAHAVHLLLAQRATLEATDDNGLTPLAAAVQAAEPGEDGQWDRTVDALLKAGADTSVLLDGTPLPSAARERGMDSIAARIEQTSS